MGVLKKLLSYDTVFTEELLQRIREQYIPTNWVSGEVITATRLNHMEQGIYENSKMAENTVQQDGEYPFLTAGLAENLESDTFTVNQTPYFIRPVINDSDREIDSVVGGSVGWNQLCNGASVTVQSGHKYYMVKSGTASIDSSDGTAITGLTSGTDIVTDLTLLLGSTIADYIYTLETATAGAGMAKLKSWGFFTKDYYAYDAGSLKSVDGLESHETVGFNQWDEEWESGYYDVADGSKKANSSWARNKELIPVVPNTKYTFKANTSETVGGIGYILFYDGSKQYINSYIQITSNICGTTGQQFTVPSNACYISFYMNVAWQSVGICINIHWDGERNGEYEPYVKHSYPLDSSLTLRGIPKLDANNQLYYDGDVYEADGTVTRRYGVVDLGTLDWNQHSDVNPPTYPYGYFGATVPGKANGEYNLFSSAYPLAYPSFSRSDKVIIGSLDSGIIYIIDSTYASYTEEQFVEAISGVYLVYELATPTTETADPFQNPQLVSAGGTEEYVSTGIVPVGHYTQYPENLKAKLESMPTLPTQEGVYVLKYGDGVASYILLETDETVVDMLARIAALEGE